MSRQLRPKSEVTDLTKAPLGIGDWETDQEIHSSPEIMRLRVEAKKACEKLDFEAARWHRTLLLTNAGADLDAPWIPYDLFYLARILLKLQEWEIARDRFAEAQARFEALGFIEWRTACLFELEWLGDFQLLKQREDLWMEHMRALQRLEWAGYHRWMHRVQIGKLAGSSPVEFRTMLSVRT